MKVTLESSSRIATVDDAEAAKLLTATDRLELLGPFMGREKSISQAAEEASSPLLKMYRFVQKALSTGVLEHTRSEPRRGRPVNYYRASAEEFFVPYGDASQVSFEELYSSSAADLRDALFKSLLACFEAAATASGGTLGLRVFKDVRGELNLIHALGPSRSSVMKSFLAPDAPAVWGEWATVTLDFETAKALQQSLYRTVRQAASHETGVSYLLRVALVPLSS